MLHIEGRILFKSARDQPIASLLYLSTLNSLSSFDAVRDAEIITGRVQASPRYAYLKWQGNGFFSTLGGCLEEGSGV